MFTEGSLLDRLSKGEDAYSALVLVEQSDVRQLHKIYIQELNDGIRVPPPMYTDPPMYTE